MRTTSDAWRHLVAYSHRIVTVVESWLAGVQLARTVPLAAGTLTYDDTGVIKRRLTLSVPTRAADGTRWDPAGQPLHPLANYGQRLHVYTGLSYANGAVEVMDHGWYLITGWKRDEDSQFVEVEAFGLARLLVDAKLSAPSAPPVGATFAGEARRLVEPILPVLISSALVDRPVPATVVWEREREKSLDDLCSAWPARWHVGDDGAVHFDPPYGLVTPSTVPDVVLTDGTGGTVVTRARSADRGALYNRAVVTGKAPDDGSAVPFAVRDITDPTSPIRTAGPYGAVPRFYASDLITTQAQAQAAADALIVEYGTAGRAEPVTCIPDPSIELGDVARVNTRDGDRYTARVSSMTLPLTAEGGPMTVTPAMLPAGVT